MDTQREIDVDDMAARALARRRELGLDQAQLAERAGMSREYISGLETSRNRNPKVKDLNKVAKALRKPLVWLLYGDPPSLSAEEEMELEELRAHPDLRIQFAKVSRAYGEGSEAERRGMLEALRFFARAAGIPTGE